MDGRGSWEQRKVGIICNIKEHFTKNVLKDGVNIVGHQSQQ